MSACFISCFASQSREPPPGKAKELVKVSNGSGNDENDRSRRSMRMLSKLGSINPPSFTAGAFDSSRIDIEAAAVNAALIKVGTLVQRFANMRQQGTCLKSMHQALGLITEEWPGAFACIHILSKEEGRALLVSGAVAASIPCNPALEAALASQPLLHLMDTAMTRAQASLSGCYSWQDSPDCAYPAPPDYRPFVLAGARAISTIVIALPGTNSAALTVGFVDGADTSHVAHELWPAYLKVIAAGMSPLILEPSIPQYLTLAVDLDEAELLDDVMLSVVRHMRELSGQASNMQLWFRVALVGRTASKALLFDVPSEVTSSLHITRSTGSRRASCCQLQPLSSGGTPVFRRRPRPARSVPQIGLTPTRSADLMSLSTERATVGSPLVLRTEVSLENTMLKQVMGKRQLAIIPNVQKLVNHGGGVAEDIFAVQSIRPPVSMLLLPLIRSHSAGGEGGGARAPDGPGSPNGIGRPGDCVCYGAVYCMSSVLSDFVDLKLRLYESVVKVLSPHLYSALAREPLATEYHQAIMHASQSMGDLALGCTSPSAISSFDFASGGANSLFTKTLTSPMPFGSGRCLREVISYSAGGSDDTKSSAAGPISSPTSYTSALVTGLTDKINSRRLVHNLDITETSDLTDLQLLGLLGTGGYGLVFKGRWCGMLAAVKMVYCPKVGDEDAGKTVLKHAHEIAILSSVSHPNIIQAYGFLTNVRMHDIVDVCLPALSPDDHALKSLVSMVDSSCHVEVLELCDRGSVFDALQRGDFLLPRSAFAASSTSAEGMSPSSTPSPSSSSGRSRRLNVQAILVTLMELASALSHLHSLGIVHCDIKPDNVLLKSSSSDERGFTVKLSDFGLSRVQDDDGYHSFPCNSRGTLAYLSPEALSGRDVDESTDVYSFGILMYELYAHTNPFNKMKPDELFQAVVRLGQRPRFPVGSHEGYVSLAQSCWHDSSERRPSFEEITHVLKRLLTGVRYVDRSGPSSCSSPFKS